MGTRSVIGKVNTDGTVTGIYCHWDGYPSHNGVILRDHYNTNVRIGRLMRLGDLSTLGAEIGKKHKFDQYVEGVCTAYKRDRGETGTEAVVYKDRNAFIEEDRGQEFTYLWDGYKWLCWKSWGNKEDVDLYNMVDEEA
jgi:hypothetical protein